MLRFHPRRPGGHRARPPRRAAVGARTPRAVVRAGAPSPQACPHWSHPVPVDGPPARLWRPEVARRDGGRSAGLTLTVKGQRMALDERAGRFRASIGVGGWERVPWARRPKPTSARRRGRALPVGIARVAGSASGCTGTRRRRIPMHLHRRAGMSGYPQVRPDAGDPLEQCSGRAGRPSRGPGSPRGPSTSDMRWAMNRSSPRWRPGSVQVGPFAIEQRSTRDFDRLPDLGARPVTRLPQRPRPRAPVCGSTSDNRLRPAPQRARIICCATRLRYLL